MATALELFKQANLESILNPAMIGAGIGGLGYGASSFINDEEKDTSTKLKNSLLSALKGAGIGGLAGAGYGAGKEVLSQLSAPKDAVGKLLQNNPNLDASPHGKNHFIESMAGNVASSPYAAAGLGAAGGLGFTAAARGAGQTAANGVIGNKDLFKGNKEPSLSDQARGLKGARAAMEGTDQKSFLSRLFDTAKNKTKDTGLARQEAMRHLVNANHKTVFPQEHGAAHRWTPPSSSNPMGQRVKNTSSESARKIMDMLGEDNLPKTAPAPSGLSGLFSKLFGSASTNSATPRHAAMQEVMQGVKSPTMQAAKQYGGNALKGGVLGLGAYSLANMGMKGYLNAKYDDDQLKLWNELAK